MAKQEARFQVIDGGKSTNTRYGPMRYYADDQFIGHALEKYGEYSEAEVDLWRKVIKPGDTVVEVGANIGSLTLPLASLVGRAGTVHAFEPQPENYDLLVKQPGVAGGTVIFRDCALGSVIGEIKIPRLSELRHTNYGAVEAGAGGFTVPLKTLDSFGLEGITFIKIDVEGMEAEVLRGARETIARCRPVLYVEDDRANKSAELQRLLREMIYRLYKHLPPLYSAANFKGAPVDEQQIISINLLCVPIERTAEFEEATSGLTMIVAPARGPRQQWAGIVRLGGIGDNLIAASVLKPLKAMGYKIDVLAKSPQSAIFENNPYVDKLSIKEDRHLPQGNMLEWQKWFWARGQEYDKFVNLSHSCEALLAQFEASTAYWWPVEWRRKHCGQNYLEAVHDIVGVPYDFGPLFWPTDEEKEQAAHTRRKYCGDKPVIGWVITGTRPDKVYPFGPIAVARLIRELDCFVVLMGGPPPLPDYQFAEQIREHVVDQNGTQDGFLIAASPDPDNPTWPIRRVLTFAAQCDLVIGPDTGPMWGVAFEPVPKIMLHSHASVENITKHWVNTTSLHADPAKVPCWSCHLLHDKVDTCVEMQRSSGMNPPDPAKVTGAACIRDISTELVMTAAKAALGDKSSLARMQKQWPSNFTLVGDP